VRVQIAGEQVLTIRGDSYRLREKRRSGLLAKAETTGKTGTDKRG